MINTLPLSQTVNELFGNEEAIRKRLKGNKSMLSVTNFLKVVFKIKVYGN